MPAKISFFDMEVSVTPPGGHAQPVPLTLGANWQPGDYRMLFACVYATSLLSDGTTELEMQMTPDPPTGFTAAFSITPGVETYATYYRLLQAGDTDTSVSFPKPAGYRIFMWATMTVRGVNPTVAPVAGRLGMSYINSDVTATVNSITVPAAGAMALCVATIPDPGVSSWPGWASAMGIPTGWTPMVSTDKSGSRYFAFDTNPAINIVGKNYGAAGSTGSVSVPVTPGSPALAGMYAFFQPAPDVSVTIGAA